MPTYGAPTGPVRPGPGHRAVGPARASGTSTSSAAWPSPAWVTPTRPSPPRSTEQAATLLHVSNLFATQPGHRRGDHARPAATAAAVRSSSATPAPRPTRPPSSWPASGADRASTASCRPTAASTVAPWRRSPPPASPRSRSRSSRCPRASATSPGTTSTRSTNAIDPTVAAVLLEPIQGEGGVNPADPEYIDAASARLCDERDLLLMVDEVQTGLGRTGDWFGYQHFGVRPDVVTMAKALGNGVPIGACWARADVASVWARGDHATTFGGQPLPAAAARAVLAEMEAIDAPALAQRAGARLADALAALPGGRRRSGASGCCWPPSWRASTPRTSTPARSRPGWSSTRRPRPRCGSRRRSRSATSRSTRPWPSWPASWPASSATT